MIVHYFFLVNDQSLIITYYYRFSNRSGGNGFGGPSGGGWGGDSRNNSFDGGCNDRYNDKGPFGNSFGDGGFDGLFKTSDVSNLTAAKNRMEKKYHEKDLELAKAIATIEKLKKKVSALFTIIHSNVMKLIAQYFYF